MLWVSPLPRSPSFPCMSLMQAGVFVFTVPCQVCGYSFLPPSKHCDLWSFFTIIYPTGRAVSTSSKQASEENKMLEPVKEQRCSLHLPAEHELVSNKSKIWVFASLVEKVKNFLEYMKVSHKWNMEDVKMLMLGRSIEVIHQTQEWQYICIWILWM